MLSVNISLMPDAITLKRAMDRLGGGITGLMNDRLLLRELAITYTNLLRGRTPVDTGHAKSFWMYRLTSGTEAEFINGALSSGGYCYPLSLEYGWRLQPTATQGVGPRTMIASNEDGQPRVYSRQAPGGMAGPAFRILPKEMLFEGIINQLIAAFSGGS